MALNRNYQKMKYMNINSFNYRNLASKANRNSSYVSAREKYLEQCKNKLIQKALQRKKASDRTINIKRRKPFKVALEKLL